MITPQHGTLAPGPTPADKRALMAVAATTVDRSLKLAPAEQDTEGLAAVDAWLMAR